MGSEEKLALSEIHFLFCRSLKCVQVLANGLSAVCWTGVSVLQPRPEKGTVSDRGACAELAGSLDLEAAAAGATGCELAGGTDNKTTEKMALNAGAQFIRYFESKAV